MRCPWQRNPKALGPVGLGFRGLVTSCCPRYPPNLLAKPPHPSPPCFPRPESNVYLEPAGYPSGVPDFAYHPVMTHPRSIGSLFSKAYLRKLPRGHLHRLLVEGC